ncbi:MAG: hypothetical protein ABI068_00785 [Ktedonobacterales bacterium]
MTDTTQRLRSSLQTPDESAWGHDTRYSKSLAEALREAYRLFQVAPHKVDTHFQAYMLLTRFRGDDLCPEQRLRLEYALALTYAEEEATHQTLECLSNAYDIAAKMTRLPALVEIGLLKGGLLQGDTQYDAAYYAYGEALIGLQLMTRTGPNGHADPGMEMDLLMRMMGCAWERGNFPTALHHLEEARSIHGAFLAGDMSREATLNWLNAVLARAMGAPMKAFSLATLARNVYLHLPLSWNTGRIHTIVADCALDILEARQAISVRMVAPGDAVDRVLLFSPDLPGGFNEAPQEILRLDPDLILNHAADAAQTAFEFAQAAVDSAGAELARLAMQRSDRVARRIGVRHGGAKRDLHLAQRMTQTAQSLGDVLLRGRAVTALGDALLAEGDIDAARTSYRQACGLLGGYGFGGHALWPRRALIALDDLGA